MIICGDARRIPLASESVQCVVTSPPYWGLRDYGLPPSVWYPSRARKQAVACAHDWATQVRKGVSDEKTRWQHTQSGRDLGTERITNPQAAAAAAAAAAREHPIENTFCQNCGAWRGLLGLEPTPELYVKHCVEVFREVRRVLKPGGTLWLNLGDSYYQGLNGNSGEMHPSYKQASNKGSHSTRSGDGLAPNRCNIIAGLKPKDLVGIPWRVAFALQRDGWWLRSDIIWAKPNPMPESVTDRPTKSHEYLFLLTKSARYFFDQDAVREPFTDERMGRDYPADTSAHAFTVNTNKPGKHWKTPDGWDTSTGNGAHGSIHRIGREGRNSRMHHDRDPKHSSERKQRERNRGGRTDGFTKPNNIDPSANGGRNIRTVWSIPTEPYRGAHFATFPQKLVEPCILAGSAPGDLVFDPFGGTGTVGRVAERLSRRWVCLDLKYHDLSAKRTRGIQKDLLLTAGEVLQEVSQ